MLTLIARGVGMGASSAEVEEGEAKDVLDAIDVANHILTILR